MAQLINEAKRFQKLAGLITEAEAETSTPSTSTITAKIDQNLDKIESLPIVQQTAEKIMANPKLMQQFQQGLSKMGISADLMKENEDVDSNILSKIVSAAASKEKQLQEESGIDDRGGAIIRGFFGMPLLLGALDEFVGTDIISTITKGMGTNASLMAIAGVGALIGGIIGHIAYKKRQKQQQKESLDIESTVNETLTKFRKNGK